MTYTPTTWTNGVTSANATTMNNIEGGIVNAALASDAVALATTTPLADTAAGTAGTGITASRGDHAHPATVSHGVGLYGSGVPLAGSVLCVYHQPTGPVDGSTMIVNAAGPITALPIYRRQTIKEMNIKIGTAGDASATTAFAIYAVSAAGVITGAPLHTSSFIATTSTGVKTWSSLTMTLDPGVYNIVLNSKGFSATRPLARTVVGSLPYLWIPALSTGSSTSDTVAGFVLSTVNETSGAFPSSITIGSDLNWTNNLPSAFWYGYQADAA